MMTSVWWTVMILLATALGSQSAEVRFSQRLANRPNRVPSPSGELPGGAAHGFTFTNQRPLCADSTLVNDTLEVTQPACYQRGCFTISSWVRVENKHPHTLFSYALPVSHFEITFRRQSEIRVQYTSTDGREYSYRFLHWFHANRWYRLAVTICPSKQLIKLWVDCNIIYQETAPRPIRCSPDLSRAKACLGGNSTATAAGGFRGSIQDLRITDDDMPTNCEDSCEHNKRALVSQLESSERSCTKRVISLSQRLRESQSRLWECTWNGQQHDHGSTWTDDSQCQQCTCQESQVTCDPKLCDATPICRGKHIRLMPANKTMGECCPYCGSVRAQDLPTSCQNDQRVWYYQGDVMPSVGGNPCYPSCVCRNGAIHCPRKRCSLHITCPGHTRKFTHPSICCPYCTVDVCSAEQPCGPSQYADCHNLPGGRTKCMWPCKYGGVQDPDAGDGHCKAPVTTVRPWWEHLFGRK